MKISKGQNYVATIPPQPNQRQLSSSNDSDVPLARLLVAIVVISVLAVLAVVAMSPGAINQVAPSAIAAISGVGLAAIGSFSVVLRRRTRRSTRS
ncbi:hypothetical protein [Micromonospora sp. WMMD736]|uniref:hypothetical protein n=1 Tax=Micromonospora sp. WMMD736 TaxID=3404112 RepID=UPI003B94B344